MVEHEEDRLLAKVAALIEASQKELKREIAELRQVVNGMANRCCSEDNRISKMESWRAREEKARDSDAALRLREEDKRDEDIRDLHELNMQQMKILSEQQLAFAKAEASRAGALSFMKWTVGAGTPFLVAAISAITWYLQHR